MSKLAKGLVRSGGRSRTERTPGTDHEEVIALDVDVPNETIAGPAVPQYNELPPLTARRRRRSPNARECSHEER